MIDTTEVRACQDVQGRLTALLDNELAADETTAVRAHLADCPSCRQEWESLTATKDLAAQWPEEDQPDLWPALQAQAASDSLASVMTELRALRSETQALRREVAQLRQDSITRPAPTAGRSTPLDLPYVPKVSRSLFQIV